MLGPQRWEIPDLQRSHNRGGRDRDHGCQSASSAAAQLIMSGPPRGDHQMAEQPTVLGPHCSDPALMLQQDAHKAPPIDLTIPQGKLVR
jgi:hypothetical protein